MEPYNLNEGNIMAFEVFKQVGANTKVFISIASSKTFGFPRTFLDKYGITNNHKVVLLYDSATKRVALHFTTEEVKHGMKVIIPNEKHGGSINARAFFELKGIDAKRYANRYEDFEVVPLVELGVSAPGSAFVISLRNNDTNQSSEGTQM